MIRFRSGAATDAGRRRTENQDRYGIVDDALYCVADGVGGHRGGEVAAQLAVDGLIAFGRADQPRTHASVEQTIADANASILHASAMNDDLHGMSTTLTMLVVSGTREAPMLLVANLGDSRTYRMRNGELEQLTDDHSVVADLLREGTITSSDVSTHPMRSVITRALGVETAVRPDVLEIIPAPDSRYLLCSDGLTGEVPDELIASVLRQLADPNDAAHELVRLAVERGGRDNVTVVVVDLFDDRGRDEAALRAAAGIRTTSHTAAIGAGRQDSAADDAVSQRSARRSTGEGAEAPRVRKPWPVNLRVLLFIGLLAALAAAVMVIVKNAPSTTDTVPLGPPTEITPAATTPTEATPAGTTPATTPAAPAPDDVAPAATTPATTPATDAPSNAATPTTPTILIGPTTILDDFAPTTAAPTTRASRSTRAARASARRQRTTRSATP